MRSRYVISLVPVLVTLNACVTDLDIGEQVSERECDLPGATRLADDGCNTCTCSTEGTWDCSERDCDACTPGDKRDADDGCNTCTCKDDGQWSCTAHPCPLACTPGATRPADDDCNVCECLESGSWECTSEPCGTDTCTPGATKLADDGCNVCECLVVLDVGPRWQCSQDSCEPECTIGATKEGSDCNVCECVAGPDDVPTWECTADECDPCTAGETRPLDDCNSCMCALGAEGTTEWICSDDSCECRDDTWETPLAGGLCNICSCVVVLDVGPEVSCEPGPCDTASCTPSTEDLITLEGRVDDDTVDLHGSVFAYGDEIACSPPADPCNESGCTIAGETVIDPAYDAWGCGLGVSFNEDHDGEMAPYEGPASCFEIGVDGSTGEASVRLGFRDRADMEGRTAPFRDIGPVNGFWSGVLCTWDVECPEWAVELDLCDPVPGGVTKPYGIHIEIPGGSTEGPVTLTLRSLVAVSCNASAPQ